MRQIKHSCWFSGIAFLFVLGLYGTALGGNLCPKLPDAIPEGTPLSHPPVQKIVLGSLSIKFEQTSLQEAKNRIGVGVIQHIGDGGDSTDFLCYHTRSSGRFSLDSGEMYASDHLIYSVNGGFDAGSGKSADCPELPARFQPVSLDGWLWVGTSANQLKKRLGPPSAQKDGWLFYSYRGKTRIRDKMFDRGVDLMVCMRDGKVAQLSVTHLTTD